jgi:transposase-like protein
MGTAYYRLQCSFRIFDCVAELAVEAMSCAAIARVEGVAWNTADRRLSRATEFAQTFNDVRTKGVELVS